MRVENNLGWDKFYNAFVITSIRFRYVWNFKLYYYNNCYLNCHCYFCKFWIHFKVKVWLLLSCHYYYHYYYFYYYYYYCYYYWCYQTANILTSRTGLWAPCSTSSLESHESLGRNETLCHISHKIEILHKLLLF